MRDLLVVTPTACRSVYLCDDGNDPVKKLFINSLPPSADAHYITGRVRKAGGDVNGKSANL
jgi:hypothetical protein